MLGSKERVRKMFLNVIGLNCENFKPRCQTYDFLTLECHFRHDCARAEISRHKAIFVTIIHSVGQHTTCNSSLIQLKLRPTGRSLNRLQPFLRARGVIQLTRHQSWDGPVAT